MREAWRLRIGFVIAGLGLTQAPACLTLTTSEGGPGGAGSGPELGGEGDGDDGDMGGAAGSDGAPSSSASASSGSGGAVPVGNCVDGTQNGDEEGVDCGGSKCASCLGAPCAAGADCASGSCADGVCCDVACTETCASCNVAGSVGTCSNVPAGAEDTPCALTQACDGKGACKLKNGQACSQNAQCLSDVCAGPGPSKACSP